MSKAIKFAEILEQWVHYQSVIDYEIAAEIRRLAEIERKYNKIMAQEPVAYVSKGGLRALGWGQETSLKTEKTGKANIALIAIEKD